MEKSEVREFGMNRSIYNSKIMGMSSVLHSPRSNTERQLHLKKSRIANIPDTRNIELSDKLDFVVVFQTIQIQRMSQQIQTLRVRVRQYERQLFNIDNYEIQIKQLTERCFRLESQKNAYREELFDNQQASELIFNQLEEIKKRHINVDFTSNEKYKLQRARNDQILMEVQKWKSRYNALDQSKSKQLQTIKRMMEEQSKTHLSRQTKQLLSLFEVQKQNLEQLVNSLKQLNIEKQTQLKKNKYELQTKDKSLQQLETQVDEYEEKVALLSQQNYRLSELSKNKQIQINKLKDRFKNLEQANSKISLDMGIKNQQNKKLVMKIQKITDQMNQKDGKLNKLQKISLNDKQRLSELDRIVFLLKQRQDQIEGKNKIVERKDKKILTLQESIKQYQQTQILTLKSICSSKKQNEQMQNKISNLSQIIDTQLTSQKQIKQITIKSIKEMQDHYNSFREEINRRTQQIIGYSNNLMHEIKQNQKYILQLQNEVKQGKNERQSSENQKMQLLDKIAHLNGVQIEKDQLSEENQSLRRYIDALEDQKRQLIKSTSMKETTFMLESKLKIKQAESNFQHNVKQIENSLKSQLDRKVKEIKQKQNYLEALQNKLKIFEKEASQLKKVNEGMNKSTLALKRQKQQFQNKTRAFQAEITNKNHLISKKQSNASELKDQIQLIKKQLQQFNIQKKIQQINARIQHIQKFIKIIKTVVEKQIKQQSFSCQKHKISEIKITQLMEMNFQLIQKNGKLYELVLAGQNAGSNQINVFKRHKQLNQEINSANSIYTGINRTISSPRGANQNYNSSNIIGQKIKDTIKGNFNDEISSVPIQFLIKFVMVCAQLEALRQRIGDKNAKVEKMKNSLMVSNVSSNRSFVAIVNGKNSNQNLIHHQKGQILDTSNLISSTLINKGNPFSGSLAGTFNQQSQIIHQSRLIQTKERFLGQGNIKRVISEQHYVRTSPDINNILYNQSNKNTGIYTKRILSGSGVGRVGFKSIGLKKSSLKN